MFKRFARIAALITSNAAGIATAQAALAEDCTDYVTGVRPVSQYNHAAGNGFLAVRTGAGSGYRQFSELYLGDEVVVGQRSGNWYLKRFQIM